MVRLCSYDGQQKLGVYSNILHFSNDLRPTVPARIPPNLLLAESVIIHNIIHLIIQIDITLSFRRGCNSAMARETLVTQSVGVNDEYQHSDQEIKMQ